MPSPYFTRDRRPPVEEIPPVQSMREQFLGQVNKGVRNLGYPGEVKPEDILFVNIGVGDDEIALLNEKVPSVVIVYPPGCINQVNFSSINASVHDRRLGLNMDNVVPGAGRVWLPPLSFSAETGQPYFISWHTGRIYLGADNNGEEEGIIGILPYERGMSFFPIKMPVGWESEIFGPFGRLKKETAPVSEEQKLANLISSNPMKAWREIHKRVFAFPEYEGSLILPQGTRSAVVEGTNVHILRNAQNIRFTLTLPPEQITRFLELCGNNQFEDDQFRAIFKSGNQTADRLFIDAEIYFNDEFRLGKVSLTAQKGRWDGLKHVEEPPHPVSPEIFAHFLGLLKSAEQRTPLIEDQATIFKGRPRTKPKGSHAGDIKSAFEELEKSGTIFVGSQPNPEPKKTKKPTSSRARKAARRAELKAERRGKNKGKKRK